MKTIIVVAAHKIINDKIVIRQYDDEIEYETVEQKKLEAKVHIDFMMDEFKKSGFEVHSEAILYIDLKNNETEDNDVTGINQL